MTRGTLRMTGAALALLCMSGCVQSPPSEDESPSATPSPTPTPSPTETYTASPETAAFADAIGAQDDHSLTVSERVCALEWTMAYLDDEYAPDCYLPGVETDDLGLEPMPTPTDTTSMSPEDETTLRLLTYGLLQDAAEDSSLTQEDRECADFWIEAYENVHTYQPVCDVPGVHTDGVFGMKPNPYEE